MAEFREHPGVFRLGSLAGLIHDGLRGCDSLLGLLLLHLGRGGPGFINHLGSLLACLYQDLLRLGLGVGQFLLDLLGVIQAFLDALLAISQHGQDRLVGIAMEQEGHDAKADALRGEVRQVHTKPHRGVLGHLAQVTADAAE